jgi:hypothetical protein
MDTSSLDQLTAADLPRRFGRYELQSILGEGGMARVFGAELFGPAGFRKQVAVKVIKSEMGEKTGREGAAAFIREAQLGDLPSAETHLLQAIEICDETMPFGAGAFRGSLALIRAEQGALDEARTLLDRGEPQLRGVHLMELGKFLRKKAQIEDLAGDPAAAAAALAEAEVIDLELNATS